MKWAKAMGMACLCWAGLAWGAEVRVDKGVAYGADPQQKMDVYRPAGAGASHPAVVVLHGGGWFQGSRTDRGEVAIAQALARAGYVAVSADYRLVAGGKNRFPAQLDDVQRAVRFLRAHAERYGINPERIGAMGQSAGGHLAALLGTLETRDNGEESLAKYSSRVEAVVSVYGPMDLMGKLPAGGGAEVGAGQGRSASHRGADGAAANGAAMVLNLMGKRPEDAPELYRLASPVAHVDGKTCAFLIMHGEEDRLVPIAQSEAMARALRKAGRPVTLERLAGEGHGFTAAGWQKVQRDALGFFGRELGGERKGTDGK